VVWLDGDGVRVHSHAGDPWDVSKQYVLDTLGEIFPNKPQPRRPVQPHENEKNLFVSQHLWSCAEPARNTIVETYLGARGCKQVPKSIRFLPKGRYPDPAMIAAFGVADEPEPGTIAIRAIRGVHLTFLKPDGSGKAEIDIPKITLGPSASFPIVIAQPNDLLGLAITEGIEDAVTVHEATGLGVWAAGSAGRMPALATRVPGYIEVVTIYMDADPAGEKGAYALADALDNLGVEVLIESLA
jgi:hypothetical protein